MNHFKDKNWIDFLTRTSVVQNKDSADVINCFKFYLNSGTSESKAVLLTLLDKGMLF